MAAYLHPPLSDYDLLGALTAHYAYDVQKCMISANLKSNQDALSLLGKLQAIYEGNAQKETRGETRHEFRGRDNRQTGNDRGENRRGHYNQTVRHITYDRRQNNSRAAHGNRRETRYDQTEGRSSHRDNLNPRAAEFAPTAGRAERVTDAAVRTGAEAQQAEN
jgi:hypothetical protein